MRLTRIRGVSGLEYSTKAVHGDGSIRAAAVTLGGCPYAGSAFWLLTLGRRPCCRRMTTIDVSAKTGTTGYMQHIITGTGEI